MSPFVAWIAALAVVTSSASPPGERPPPEASGEARVVPVTLDLGPTLVRRMGVRLTVRRAGDDPIAHRPVEVHELPPPATSDDPPSVARLELGAGSYIIEAEAPGFLPSTRALTIDPENPPGQLGWQLLADSAHRTVRFPISAGASVPPTVTLSARHLAGEQNPVACTSRRVACELRLRRGEWEVEASAAGYRTLRRVVTIGEDATQEVPLSLVPGLIDHTLPSGPATPQVGPQPGPAAPAEAPARPPERKLLAGLAIAGVPLIAGGLALTVVGRVRFSRYAGAAECDNYGKTCADLIIPQIHTAGVGTGLLGAGLGLALGGLAPARGGRAGWGAALAVGSALTIGGGAWLVGNSILLNRTLKTGPLDEIEARDNRRMISTGLLGAGLGVLTSAILVGARGRRPAAATARRPEVAPWGAGLALSGRF